MKLDGVHPLCIHCGYDLVAAEVSGERDTDSWPCPECGGRTKRSDLHALPETFTRFHAISARSAAAWCVLGIATTAPAKNKSTNANTMFGFLAAGIVVVTLIATLARLPSLPHVVRRGWPWSCRSGLVSISRRRCWASASQCSHESCDNGCILAS